MVKAEFQDIPAGLFFEVFPQVIWGLSYSTVGGCSSNMSGIVSAWMQHDSLVMRASHGQIALTGHTLKRRDVVANAVVLIPAIGELGVRPTVDQIEEHVAMFFEMARPKGKPRLSRYLD